jgi:phospholipase C
MSPSILPQVKNIVFLMLENRSLDNLLGWLYNYTGQPSAPANVYPSGSSGAYDGLTLGRYSNPAYTWDWGWKVEDYPVVPVPSGLGADQDRVPAYDPYEEMKIDSSWNGVLNQMFGNQDIISGLPASETPAGMNGFLQDYYSGYMISWKGLDILWTYTPAADQLPVLNKLGVEFAVSDHWFCSAPTQTNPNRAFSLCGTSLGRENNLNMWATEQFDVPTVINYLASAGKTWALYFTDTWVNGQSYTQYTFPQISSAGGEFGTIDQFEAHASGGTLPDFTYLEPKWGYGKGSVYVQGTDYHPPTHLSPGEQFLNQVYQAIRNSPQWEEILLIVTFDEHGGTYDHVPPSWGAIPPDANVGKDGFRFDLFGARVPTLLISPFVKPSTVFREPSGSSYPFDHTSFIKTLLLWAGVDLGAVDLGKRMPQAPTFEDVLEQDHVNTGPGEMSAPAVAAAAHAEGTPGGGPDPPLNAVFEGVGFAATKAILNSGDPATIHAEIERYQQDPETFEAALVT